MQSHSLNNLPQLDLIQTLNCQNDISNLDPDLNIPSQCNFKHYTADEFRNDDIIKNCISVNHLSFLHNNIRSLNASFDNFVQMLSELSCSFSVIGLTETRLNDRLESTFNHHLDSYSFVSQHSLSNAGGVGFYVKDNCCYDVRYDLSDSVAGFETLWIEIQSNHNQNIICGVFYRHPHSNIDAFITFLNQTLDKISNEQKNCVLMGDFNLNLLNVDSHPSTEEFLNTFGTYFYNPHILQPTRITNHSATLIDNIFFNSSSHHTISGNLVYDLSDHLPNFLIINSLSTLPKNIEISRRDYSQFNQSNLINDFESVDWSFNSSSNDVNVMFDTFYSRLSNIIDRHIPIKKLSAKEIKQLSKPWITSGIRRSIRIKNKLYKRFIKTQSAYYHTKFKLYRNKLNHLIKISKVNYYRRYFSSNTTHIKNIWD